MNDNLTPSTPSLDRGNVINQLERSYLKTSPTRNTITKAIPTQPRPTVKGNNGVITPIGGGLGVAVGLGAVTGILTQATGGDGLRAFTANTSGAVLASYFTPIVVAGLGLNPVSGG